MQTVIDTIRKQRGEQQADMLIIHGSEVSELESKGENTPQIGPDGKPRGPGRGIFQYEISKNGSGASKTALNRYKRFYSKKGYGGTMPEEYAQEIKNLSKLIRPHIGIITNIGEAHIENFKNIDGIAKAKAEIITPTKTAIAKS